MKRTMDFHQMAPIHTCVDLGRRNVRVAQQLLDIAKIRAALKKVRRE
jgi:hypothetical protein